MSNELSAEMDLSIPRELYDQFYRIFDEVLETHDAIADESHFCELAVWLANKLSRERAEKAAEEGSEFLQDYSHLYGFKVGVCYPVADEKAVRNNIERFLQTMSGKKELLKRADNFKKLLEDCRDDLDKILACIKEKGLCDAISCFITDKTRSADEALMNIAWRLGRVLLRIGKVAVAHMADLYPLEDKYCHMGTYKKDELPYIVYEILPISKNEREKLPKDCFRACWPKFSKIIDDAREIIEDAIAAGKLITCPNAPDRVEASELALWLKNRIKKDSNFPLPLPEWMKKKIGGKVKILRFCKICARILCKIANLPFWRVRFCITEAVSKLGAGL
ncbi:MAG: hypothetical protein LBI30_00615 [Holosporales bacterium]|jgi:hypothetical protein|nr:hypothetical protein [Holosporales bacterium]